MLGFYRKHKQLPTSTRDENISLYISGCKPQPHEPVLWGWVRLKVHFVIWYQSSFEELCSASFWFLFPPLLFLVIFFALFQNLDWVSKSLGQCLMKTLVLIVVTLLHAIFVVNTEAICFRKVGFPSGNVKTSKFSSTRKVCTFCNHLGHTVDTCYKKNGFPPGYKFINWTSQANNMITTDTFS